MKNPIIAEIRRSRITQVSLVVAILYVLVAIFGPLIAPHSPTALLSASSDRKLLEQTSSASAVP